MRSLWTIPSMMHWKQDSTKWYLSSVKISKMSSAESSVTVLRRSQKLAYAFQEINDLPGDFRKPADRTKPWGTGHAVLAAKKVLSGAICCNKMQMTT